jgi:hypothetical protein
VDAINPRHAYLAIRVLAILVIGWMIGFKEPEKLLIALVCLTALTYGTAAEAALDKTEALDKQRAELVREQYGRPLR